MKLLLGRAKSGISRLLSERLPKILVKVEGGFFERVHEARFEQQISEVLSPISFENVILVSLLLDVRPCRLHRQNFSSRVLVAFGIFEKGDRRINN